MIIAIVGATATGKTALSLEVADILGGAEKAEIISADAMQLYRGMDIGTAKIPYEERRGIAHHQLDVLDVRDEASVAAYQRYARADLEDIQARGKTPIIVGGSGLYVSGLLDELDFPGHDDAIRQQLEEEYGLHGIEKLREELRDKDPQAYEAINPANHRRIIRALEVIRLTGRPFTARFPRHTSHYRDIHMFGVMRDKAVLRNAIEERTASMFAHGLVEETRVLINHGLLEGKTARTATGYREAVSVIQGDMSVPEAQEAVSTATRKLAKKQRTWFKADPRIEWIDLTFNGVKQSAEHICRHLNL